MASAGNHRYAKALVFEESSDYNSGESNTLVCQNGILYFNGNQLSSTTGNQFDIFTANKVTRLSGSNIQWASNLVVLPYDGTIDPNASAGQGFQSDGEFLYYNGVQISAFSNIYQDDQALTSNSITPLGDSKFTVKSNLQVLNVMNAYSNTISLTPSTLHFSNPAPKITYNTTTPFAIQSVNSGGTVQFMGSLTGSDCNVNFVSTDTSDTTGSDLVHLKFKNTGHVGGPSTEHTVASIKVSQATPFNTQDGGGSITLTCRTPEDGTSTADTQADMLFMNTNHTSNTIAFSPTFDAKVGIGAGYTPIRTFQIGQDNLYFEKASNTLQIGKNSKFIFGSNVWIQGTGGAGLTIGPTTQTGTGSIAIGDGTMRSSNSVGIGWSLGTVTEGSVQIGYNARSGVSTENVISIGRNSKAGVDCISIGSNAGTLTNQFAISIGEESGAISQGIRSVAIGNQAGQINQQLNCVAIGYLAGQSNQVQDSVAVGAFCGKSNQGAQCIAMGVFAGEKEQGGQSISIGRFAGQNSQNNNSIAFGNEAAVLYQNAYSIAIGNHTGRNYQNAYSIAIGTQAGQNAQSANSISFGTLAGRFYQNTYSIAIGHRAGYNTQNSFSISIGNYAGESNQGLYAVAIGNNAGGTSQGSDSIAIGAGAGTVSQNTQCISIGVHNDPPQSGQYKGAISIGHYAGNATQQSYAVAIGEFAGYTGQAQWGVAIGNGAGQISQEQAAVAIGVGAGQTSQGSLSVAIGQLTGYVGQNAQSVAIGYASGQNAQGTSTVAIGNQTAVNYQADYAIAIGKFAGYESQNTFCIAMGHSAGNTDQGSYAIAIGKSAGYVGQNAYSVAIGASAGYNRQGSNSVAVGLQCGETTQGLNTLAIGQLCGRYSQNAYSVAIGNEAGVSYQGSYAIAIGAQAGKSIQNQLSVAIGKNAGEITQGGQCVAIGYYAGKTDQSSDAVAIGRQAGRTSQKGSSVAIGAYAARENQDVYSVAVGYGAGDTSQGAYAIALGFNAGRSNQSPGSVAINGGFAELLAPNEGFYINPVRQDSGEYILKYNGTTKEVTYESNVTLGQQTTDLYYIGFNSRWNSAVYNKAVSNRHQIIQRANIANGTLDFELSNSPSGDYNTTSIMLRLDGPNELITSETDFDVNGTLSKSSGSFSIDHPLESMRDTHKLRHSFVEAPRFDNIYRDTVRLENGVKTINLDTHFRMTEGTFEALNRDISVFTSNEETWDAVRGKVNCNILTIECQNPTSTATVSFMVVGERHDEHVKGDKCSLSDENGMFVPEVRKTSQRSL